MKSPTRTIVNLLIMAALVSAACASRQVDGLPTARAINLELQQVQNKIVGPASYNIIPGQVGSLDFALLLVVHVHSTSSTIRGPVLAFGMRSMRLRGHAVQYNFVALVQSTTRQNAGVGEEHRVNARVCTGALITNKYGRDPELATTLLFCSVPRLLTNSQTS